MPKKGESPYGKNLPPGWTVRWTEQAWPHNIWQVFDENGRHVADQWHDQNMPTEGHIKYLWFRYEQALAAGGQIG